MPTFSVRLGTGTPLLLVAGQLACHSIAALAEPVPPYSIRPFSGGGQIAPSNRVFSNPLVARVLDANGDPVPGVTVHFAAPHCLFGGAICFEPSAYPFFPSHVFDVAVTTDADGLARSPLVQAGNQADIGEGTLGFEFVATVQNAIPTSFAIESATFILLQADMLESVPITAGYTGSWYNPEQNGQGLTVEVLSGNRMLVNWNTFTPDGSQQAWLGGVAEILGRQAVTFAVRPEGGRFAANFEWAPVSVNYWGSLTLVFSDCNHGRLFWAGDSGFASPWGVGEVALTRLTLPEGLSCP